jgi:hypothetical protein
MIDLTTPGKPPGHRASYLLERGTWKGTCLECGWSVSGATRRQTASQFRVHIHDTRVIRLDLPRLDGAPSTPMANDGRGT